MIRKIIEIDEDKCTGCGKCTVVCAEAALEIVDGKAKVVGDFLCDGLGACLDVCDFDALHIVEKETAEYDPKLAFERVKELRGEDAAMNVHGAEELDVPKAMISHGGCPGSMMQDLRHKPKKETDHKDIDLSSELRQWPVQLHLLNPNAPYLNNADLVIAADCAPFAYPNFHQKFLKDKILVILCPKLDDGQDDYIDKLADIFKNKKIKSITIVHMEVPCCFGIEHIVKQALQKSGKNIIIKDYTISVSGDII